MVQIADSFPDLRIPNDPLNPQARSHLLSERDAWLNLRKGCSPITDRLAIDADFVEMVDRLLRGVDRDTRWKILEWVVPEALNEAEASMMIDYAAMLAAPSRLVRGIAPHLRPDVDLAVLAQGLTLLNAAALRGELTPEYCKLAAGLISTILATRRSDVMVDGRFEMPDVLLLLSSTLPGVANAAGWLTSMECEVLTVEDDDLPF